jgi:hypothetical protein
LTSFNYAARIQARGQEQFLSSAFLQEEKMVALLVLKLILTPILIGAASLVGRRWGPSVGGWLVGLPFTSGPVAFFLALEQGTTFASHAAQGTLVGIISVAAFCLTYSWLSLRVGWPGCWLASWSVFFVATLALDQLSLPLPLAFTLVLSILLVAFLLLPRHRGQVIETKPPSWDILGRMLIATAFVLILTGAAPILGPHLSGLLSPLPIFATVLAVFSHRFQGATAARQVLQGLIFGSVAFAIFFLIVTTLIVPWGIFATFSLALSGALLMQGCSLWLVSRLQPRL